MTGEVLDFIKGSKKITFFFHNRGVTCERVLSAPNSLSCPKRRESACVSDVKVKG